MKITGSKQESSIAIEGLPPQAILEVEDLSVSFTQYTSGLKQQELQVISNLDVAIHPGEIVAVVGASGSGKSLLAHAILGILPGNASITGSIRYAGQELTEKLQTRLRGREIALVPQSVTYLDPLMRVGKQVGSSIKDGDPTNVLDQVFRRYQLQPGVKRLFPHELSGGMARRILVATALLSEARLIIADEPTPGLDPAVLGETLSHFRELADQGRAVMLITHDIETALNIADRIAVFYAGTTVEVAPAEDFCGQGESLRHPYSQALWRALPQNEFHPISGFQPHPQALPKGCLFEPRCCMATEDCARLRPGVSLVRNGMVRCFHAS
ncbi:MAG TPA: ABC transporter ATP-binding protein [Syntrophomonadaceae bacterium]|nr:ABC transporter ATP-binding protein [Syntrophomonadaceae bacterium]